MLNEAFDSVSILSHSCIAGRGAHGESTHRALKASPVSSFGVGGTSESFDVSGGIYERYVRGREYASRAIGALVYARSVTAVNDISKSSRSFTTIATHAYVRADYEHQA